MAGVKVAVIGGGPAGTLTAGQFAKMGASVTVYERRTPSEQTTPRLGWPITLGGVAREAIEAAGLCADMGSKDKAEGYTAQVGMFPPLYQGKWDKKGTPHVPVEHMTTRGSIIMHLREQIQEIYGSKVRFADGYSVVGGKLTEGELLVQPVQAAGAEGRQRAEQERVEADLVVLADGAGSKTRDMVQKLDPSVKVRRDFADISKLPIELPPCHPQEMASLPTPSGKPLHIVPPDHKPPIEGGWVSFQIPSPSALPKGMWFFMSVRGSGAGHDLSVTLSSLKSWWDSEKTEEETRKLLETVYPQLPFVWLRACAAAVVGAGKEGGAQLRTANFVTCSKLGSGRAVLIGDAAHAVAPNIGAGAAHAMADTMYLAATVSSLLTSTSSPSTASGGSPAEPGVVEPSSATESSSASAQEVRERLASVADVWTAYRGADARAITAISQKQSDFMFRKFQKSFWKLVASLPVQVPVLMRSWRSKWLPVKELFKPPFAGNLLMNGGARPAEVYSALTSCFYKTVAVGGAVVVCVTGVAIKGVLLLTT